MTKTSPSTDYNDKFLGFNQRTLEYIYNSKEFTYNVLEGAVRSSKTVANIYAACMAIEESKDRLHVAMGYTTKMAVKNIFESDGLGMLYFPPWQNRLYTKSIGGSGAYSLVLEPIKGSSMPLKEIIPLAGGESDSEASFRGLSIGVVIITEANLLHPLSLDAIDKRTFKADIRRFFYDFNPSSPANFLYQFMGKKINQDELPIKTNTPHPLGYILGKHKVLQYMHMTFKDNLSLSPERIEEIMISSDPNSTEHKRMILGLRASGAGLIYNITSKNIIDGQILRSHYFKWVIVIDPGINVSETAMVLLALTNDKVPEIHVLNEYSHVNKTESASNIKTSQDYAYDAFSFIKESEKIMQTQPWKIIVDPAAIDFIREFNRNSKLNNIYYPLNSAIKREIDVRIKLGQSLLASSRLRFHKFGGQKARFEFEDSEYDEEKSMKGKYERLDAPEKGKQIGMLDCIEYGIEAFSYFLFKGDSGQVRSQYHPINYVDMER